ncbi:MAG TPA: class I tRNA ligase family protein [Thermoanaerobaculia bacterium]|nr:class I tRNA ligase family protein [Thermoanaerobaculia bacterium]
MERVLITSTPPTSNGDLHVGHLSGPYVAADVYKRYLRMRGSEAYAVCGGDDHQSYVRYKAGQLGWTPEHTASHFCDEIVSTLEAASVELDLFARPLTSACHDAFVLDFFRRLHAEGKLTPKESPCFWCTHCDTYLFEAHVTGTCRHCGRSSDGNVCEACGRPNDCVDLIEPRCKHCGRTPSVRPQTRLHFPLSRWARQLAAYFERVEMESHLASLCERMLVDGLPDIPVSHPADWGLEVPVPGFEGQRLYAWAEMAPGYLSATREMCRALGLDADWESFWKEGGGRVVQFFGFDNGYFHAVLFPAELMAFDSDIRLPSAFVTNEFYRLSGSKFSTSRGHAIWGRDALAKYPADVLRFYLAYDRPETEQSNFEPADFAAVTQRELSGTWDGWLGALGRKVREEARGAAPAGEPATAQQREFASRLRGFAAEVARCYEPGTFSLQRAARLTCELVREARRFGLGEDAWAGFASAAARRQAALALELEAAATLALLSAPILPDFSSRLWAQLGFQDPVWVHGWPEGPQALPAGQPIPGLDRPFFPQAISAGDLTPGLAAAPSARPASAAQPF